MAVGAGTQTETKTVLTIDTSKSASSMKELRNQIKALKDQLVGLDESTQEYSDTLVQLGEKQHQLKEINEQVSMTNTDFGQTMSNMTNVVAGGVAAVQGMTSALSLMGVDMGSDDKLTKTLVKSMSLLQAASSMEKGIKSFAALTKVIKASTVATGGLGKALKALVSSNPIGLLLVAATALVGVITAIISKSKEMAKEATRALKDQMLEHFKQLTTWAQKFKEELQEAIGILKSGSSEEVAAFWDKNSQYMKDARSQLADFRVHLYGLRKDYEKSMTPMKARYKAEQQYLQENAAAILELRKQIEAEEAKSENVDQAKIKRLQAQIDQYSALNNLLLQEQSTWADVATQVTAVNSAVAAANQMTEGEAEDLQAVYEPLLDNFLKLLDVVPGLNAEFTYWRKDGVKSVEDLQSALNQLYVNYDYIQKEFSKRGLFNLMSEQDQDRITQQFANTNAQVAAAQRQAQRQRQQQYKDHLNKMLSDYKKHLQDRINAAKLAQQEQNLNDAQERRRKLQEMRSDVDRNGSDAVRQATIDKELMIANYNAERAQLQETLAAQQEYIDNLSKIKSPNKEIKDAIAEATQKLKEYQLQLRELDETHQDNIRESDLEVAALQREFDARMKEASAIEGQIAMMKKLQEIEEQYALDGEKGISSDWLHAFGDAGKAINDLDHALDTGRANIEGYNNTLDVLKQQMEDLNNLAAIQKEEGSFDESEYLTQMADLQTQYTETEIALSNERINQAQLEAERKKTLQQNYLSFMNGMTSALASVLDSIAEQEDVSFEDQKKLKTASAVITTLEGTIAGFMSGVNSGLPAPYNLILAAATAASVFATGMLNVRKIQKQTKDSSSAGSAATGASTVVQSPAQIVNLNQVNDEIELPDSRVYVVESDITDAQRRVQVVENNSEI